MSQDWLDQLEQKLEQKLEEFLRANPYQETLLKAQSSIDEFQTLHKKREVLTALAKEHREKLIQLAEDIRQWKERSARARKAGANQLSERADTHLIQLMSQGKRLWADFEQLGFHLKGIEREIAALSNLSKKSSSTLEQAWDNFETEDALEMLKRDRKQKQ